jgi:hypothetical protein
MHCAEGRKCGKSKATFAIEGSLVVNEYQKYKVAEWREYYVREKTGDEPPARATTPILARSRSPSPAAAVAAAAAADTELEDVIEQIKHLEIAPPKKKIIIKKREAAADVIEPLEIAPLKKKIIIKKHAPAPAREPALEFIPIADLSMERLCGNTTCGGKAMCFIASYRGATYVFKEGRKSMGYNKDYVAVDECKTAFGLNRIGMKRIISDHILEKIDKTQKYWADNWKMTPREGVVYTMMNYIDGERLIDVWKRRGAAPDEIREFMKIGIWRGIFGVSDFSTINTWVRKSDGALFSIDEHGMLGSRRDIIGEKNRKIYTANAHFLPEIWADLYHDREKKAAVLRATLEKYDFPRETVDAVLNRYENLREMVDL